MVDHSCWLPKIYRMAVLANIGGSDMSGILAGCFNTVVATCAIVGDFSMIEYGGGPGYIVVAGIALGGSGYVTRR